MKQKFFFIYETTNLIDNKRYRGYHVTTNLEDGYLGSGTYLLSAIKKYGKENFKKEILEFCETYEELIKREEFFVSEEWYKREDTYNLQRGGRIPKPKNKSSYERGLETRRRNKNLGLHKSIKGIIPWNKGLKTGPNLKTSKTRKDKIFTGEIVTWNKGKTGVQIAWNKNKKLGIRSKEANLKSSISLKEKYKNKTHPRKGKSPWNKGLKLPKDFVNGNRGRVQEQFFCSYCKRYISGHGNFKRWHGSNCKLKSF